MPHSVPRSKKGKAQHSSRIQHTMFAWHCQKLKKQMTEIQIQLNTTQHLQDTLIYSFLKPEHNLEFKVKDTVLETICQRMHTE
jgi:hypothetical protein